MDNTELMGRFLLEKVVTPVVLGMFANHEWDSIALIRDPADRRELFARIVVSNESVEVLIDYPESTESLYELQLRVMSELKDFIDHSEFACRRDEDWMADEDNAPAPGLTRTPRPNYLGPSECSMRRRRIRTRSLRVDRRRCTSAHRRD